MERDELKVAVRQWHGDVIIFLLSSCLTLGILHDGWWWCEPFNLHLSVVYAAISDDKRVKSVNTSLKTQTNLSAGIPLIIVYLCGNVYLSDHKLPLLVYSRSLSGTVLYQCCTRAGVRGVVWFWCHTPPSPSFSVRVLYKQLLIPSCVYICCLTRRKSGITHVIPAAVRGRIHRY